VCTICEISLAVYLRVSLFWDMMLHQWTIGSWHFKAKQSPNLQGSKCVLGHINPWRWGYQVAFTCLDPVIHWCTLISQRNRNWILLLPHNVFTDGAQFTHDGIKNKFNYLMGAAKFTCRSTI